MEIMFPERVSCQEGQRYTARQYCIT